MLLDLAFRKQLTYFFSSLNGPLHRYTNNSMNLLQLTQEYNTRQGLKTNFSLAVIRDILSNRKKSELGLPVLLQFSGHKGRFKIDISQDKRFWD